LAARVSRFGVGPITPVCEGAWGSFSKDSQCQPRWTDRIYPSRAGDAVPVPRQGVPGVAGGWVVAGRRPAQGLTVKPRANRLPVLRCGPGGHGAL
jgi:hypothetical protein